MPQSNTAHQDTPSDDSRKPVEKFHDGPVHVSIWENAGPRGAFRTASFQLRYRDQRNDWQTGHSYGASDLQHLENAARDARARIDNWQQTNKAQQSPKPAA
jgi:hypothetical protein